MGQLRGALKSALIGCHVHGDFELSSGDRANNYYDLNAFLLNPVGLRIACVEVVDGLGGVKFDALGCLELCPVPLIGVVASLIGKPGFVVRKARKGHGTDRLVEGDLKVNSRVVVLEDVTSTGRSVLKAVRAVEEFGCKVVRILVLINLQEGCDELLGNYDFKWLFTRKELEDG